LPIEIADANRHSQIGILNRHSQSTISFDIPQSQSTLANREFGNRQSAIVIVY